MKSDSRDLTISSVLADPMIRALMAADGVRRQDLETLLREQAQALRAVKGAQAASLLHAGPRRTWVPGACFA